MRTTIGRSAAFIGGAFFLSFGAWAFGAPQSFFDTIATWEPYNEHFLRDAGAFQAGLGIALIAALASSRGALAALIGGSAAAVLHAVSHLIDQGEGGRDSDPYVLGALAVLLVVASIVELRRTS
jgi:hypothetical protein